MTAGETQPTIGELLVLRAMSRDSYALFAFPDIDVSKDDRGSAVMGVYIEYAVVDVRAGTIVSLLTHNRVTSLLQAGWIERADQDETSGWTYRLTYRLTESGLRATDAKDRQDGEAH